MSSTANGIMRPVANNNVVAGVKRKPEEQTLAPPAKTARVDVKVPIRPTGQSGASSKASLSSPCNNGPYRGTARPGQATDLLKSKVVPGKSLPGAPTPASATSASYAPKPKRGFASIMEKAKAAQEAVKAAGSSTIKHKPVEKLTKKDRLKLEEEARLKAGTKNSKTASTNRSRSGTPADGKIASQRKGPEAGYKGTMKKSPAQPEVAYRGTMKKSQPGAPPAKPAVKKGMGQDKYGGYASWSDLDDAEEDEEGYGSEGSDDMDAGFDDMAREEELALRAARKEDQAALEEEERHKREKLERKKKLEALNKSAAARKRF